MHTQRLLVAALLLATCASLSAQRTNVVLIISDDQAFGDFGFMGHETIRTPRLDELARQSAVFTRGYVPTSLCRPSLASLATGRWPHRHSITGNDPMPGIDRRRLVERFAKSKSVPALLASRGYRCMQTGKWWEGNYRVGGFTDGMTHGDPERGGRHGDKGLQIGRKTMQPIFDFIDASAKAEKPFFLWYAPFLPHTPHNPPERLLAKYRRAGRSAFVARYFAMCEWFDETCGQLLDHLKEKGLEQDTLVLFVTDNGWIQQKGRRGFAPRSKRSPNEGGVRTPIMVRWPGRVEPGRHTMPVSSLDLAPTILAACGIEVPADFDGVDLMPLCRGKEVSRDPVFGAAFGHDIVDLDDPTRSLRARWVVAGRWKLIVPTAASRRRELYDVVADPHEARDRAADDPERVRRLQARIEAWWPARVTPRPNILLVVTDDQRNDMLGCAGHAVLKTPRMDQLAAVGVRFTNAFVTTAICAASRASILTGLHRRTHGYTFGTPPLARAHVERSYPRLLRSAGFRTGFVGKIGVRLQKGSARRMFDVFRPKNRNPYKKKQKDGSTRHLTDIIADDAVAFLRGARQGVPWCLSVSFHAPHAEDNDPAQYIWPEAFDGMYDDVDIPLPPTADAKFFAGLPEFLQESLGRVRWRWRFDTPEKRVRMTRGYYRMISGVDRAFGRILDELDRLHFAARTVVIFSSDNGYFLGERGFAGKWLIHEPSIRVPLIIRDPRLPKARRGATVGDTALNLDLASTILDLAGVPVPVTWQGRSLMPLVRGEAVPWREDFFYEHLFAHKRIPKSEGVRAARFKYVRYFEQKPVYEELYDFLADPHETESLVLDPDSAKVLAGLRKRCDELRDRYARR